MVKVFGRPAEAARRVAFIRRATVGYAVFALLWVFLSDRLLALFADVSAITRLSTLKGVLFIAVTGMLLHFLLHTVPDRQPNQEASSLLEAIVVPPVAARWRAMAIYAFALAVTVGALLLSFQLAVELGQRPALILFVLPIVFSALLGGWGPGILSTLVAAIGVARVQGPVLDSLVAMAPYDLFQWLLLVVCGLVVSSLSEALRRAGARAEAQRRLLDAVVSGSSDAIFVKDRQGRYLLCNQAAARFLGAPAEAVLGHDSRFVLPPTEAERVMAQDKAIMAEGTNGNHEEALTNLAGRTVTFLMSKGPIFGPGGDVAGIFGIARDITDRKENEERLRESEHRYRTLFEAMDEGFAVCELVSDRDGNPCDYRYLAVNPAFERLAGTQPGSAAGKTGREMAVFGDSWWLESFRRAAAGEAVSLVAHAEALGKWLDVRAFGLGGSKFACLLTDVTERQRALEEVRRLNADLERRVRRRTAQLEQSNEALLRSNMELQNFAHAAAHDLQTPLRSIAGFSQLLQGRVQGKGDREAEEWLSLVIDNTRRLQTLIQELLAYSRLDAQARPLRPTDLNKVFQSVLIALAASLSETGAQVSSGELPTVRADHTQMAQLLQNLVENGIKYNRSVPPRVVVSCRREGGEWLFSVADNGIGIDPRHHQRIFEIFRRLHSYSAMPGTGIGLAICQRIVERHGGRIWVESAVGQGSTFHFTLPAD